jgi:hypothetical protein
MTTDSPSIQAQLGQLLAQLAELEFLRALLGDELTDQKAQQPESEIRTLVQAGGGAFFAGDVRVRHGDLVAGDK